MHSFIHSFIHLFSNSFRPEVGQQVEEKSNDAVAKRGLGLPAKMREVRDDEGWGMGEGGWQRSVLGMGERGW